MAIPVSGRRAHALSGALTWSITMLALSLRNVPVGPTFFSSLNEQGAGSGEKSQAAGEAA